MPSSSPRHRDDLDLVGGEGLQRGEVARVLDQHRVARDRAARRATRSMPCWVPLMISTLSAVAAMPRVRSRAAIHSRSGTKPSVMLYWRAPPGAPSQHRRVGLGQLLDGEELRRRQPSGEGEHVGPLGHLQDLPDRRGDDAPHARRAVRRVIGAASFLRWHVGLFLHRGEDDGGVGAGDAGDGAQLLDQQAVERAGVLGPDLEQVGVLAGHAVALEHLVEPQHLPGEPVEVLRVLDAHADEGGDVLAELPRVHPRRVPGDDPLLLELRMRSATAGCDSPTFCAICACVSRASAWRRSTMLASTSSIGTRYCPLGRIFNRARVVFAYFVSKLCRSSTPSRGHQGATSSPTAALTSTAPISAEAARTLNSAYRQPSSRGMAEQHEEEGEAAPEDGRTEGLRVRGALAPGYARHRGEWHRGGAETGAREVGVRLAVGSEGPGREGACTSSRA